MDADHHSMLRSQTAPLIARWDGFLGKIRETVTETLADAEPALLELILDEDGGVVPFLESVSAVKSQIQILTTRIDPTWREKVRPLLQEADPEQESWDELRESSKGSELNDRSSEELFRWDTVVCGKAAESLHARTMKRARTTFRCTLCSADMEITENLHRAHYETCPFCSGKNTYEPSSELREALHFTADHIARYRALDAHDALDAAHERCREARVPVDTHLIDALRTAHVAYYTKMLEERIAVVPEFRSTFDKDLQARVDEFKLKESHLLGLPSSDEFNV